jgi:acyl-CoA thioesterase-1
LFVRGLCYSIELKFALLIIYYKIPNRLKVKFTLSALAIALLSYAGLANSKTIVVYGDSLSAAYGMDIEQGWVHLLSQQLNGTHTVINASISGDTTSAGLARLPITLEEFKPDLVILELGANDGLQGLPIDRMQQNLEQMIQLIQANGAGIALIGISLPASYGPRYIDSFRATFRDLAKKHSLPFIDFYREEFFVKDGYIQEDGLHPTAITQPQVRDWMLEFLDSEALLD